MGEVRTKPLTPNGSSTLDLSPNCEEKDNLDGAFHSQYNPRVRIEK
jgi:hypothetical protein